MGQFLTTVGDFRGWDVRELAGLPRRFRDGPGVPLRVQRGSIFGPNLAPTGPNRPLKGPQRPRLCEKDEHEASIVSRMNTIALDMKTKTKNLKLNLNRP